jgi:2-polyprenyl-3-methyl-5-hydroxy-6-metoxy-1,4-benzoquinol methylase
MEKNNWRIWNKDAQVEQRTFKRTLGELPEMECTKQLVKLIQEVYTPDMKVLDVGCASGHYYNGLKRINKDIKYFGIDPTVPYIEFAKKAFLDNPNVTFELGDIFEIDKKHYNSFDIVFCCNVILHLPSFQVPLKNLLLSSKKYCFIRTLISDKTHLSQYLYSDEFDKTGNPINFVYQHTYSYSSIQNFIESQGDYSVEFIKDEYDVDKINNEFNEFTSIQDAVTKVQNDLQIAGSKVFEWEWIKITRN